MRADQSSTIHERAAQPITHKDFPLIYRKVVSKTIFEIRSYGKSRYYIVTGENGKSMLITISVYVWTNINITLN